MTTKVKYAIRSRSIGGAVYIRAEDLLVWFSQEARDLRAAELDEAAEQTESLADSIRQVKP